MGNTNMIEDREGILEEYVTGFWSAFSMTADKW